MTKHDPCNPQNIWQMTHCKSPIDPVQVREMTLSLLIMESCHTRCGSVCSTMRVFDSEHVRFRSTLFRSRRRLGESASSAWWMDHMPLHMLCIPVDNVNAKCSRIVFAVPAALLLVEELAHCGRPFLLPF